MLLADEGWGEVGGGLLCAKRDEVRIRRRCGRRKYVTPGGWGRLSGEGEAELQAGDDDGDAHARVVN